ncbi:MAG: hypothetical protein GX809_01405 [Clostridiaceae bacterium]|jgi:hypothetical protein|nr:hypothetical protein [Clostridiaceae bacterium]
MTIKKIVLFLFTLLLISLLMGACQSKDEETGLPRWSFGVEGADIKVFSTFDTAKMKKVSMKVERIEDGTLVTDEVTGIPMKEILDFLGVSSYSSVTVISKTGSEENYLPDILEDPGTLLVDEVNGKSVWDETTETVQLISGKLPEARWIWHVKTLKVNP